MNGDEGIRVHVEIERWHTIADGLYRALGDLEQATPGWRPSSVQAAIDAYEHAAAGARPLTVVERFEHARRPVALPDERAAGRLVCECAEPDPDPKLWGACATCGGPIIRESAP